MGLVLEWVYGTIVSTAEKARDGAKRALGEVLSLLVTSRWVCAALRTGPNRTAPNGLLQIGNIGPALLTARHELNLLLSFALLSASVPVVLATVSTFCSFACMAFASHGSGCTVTTRTAGSKFWCL